MTRRALRPLHLQSLKDAFKGLNLQLAVECLGLSFSRQNIGRRAIRTMRWMLPKCKQ
jgi:hypothetical protein